MDILILANKVPYPPKDGGSIATMSLAQGFAQSGNQVTILAINTTKHYINTTSFPEQISGVKLLGIDLDTKIRKHKVLYNFLFSNFPYIAERFISNDYTNKLISLLSEKSFDIIQIEGLYMISYIPVIRKYSKALISFRAHNIEHEIWFRTSLNEKNIFLKKYLQNLSGRVKQFKINNLNSYDVLIPITQRDANRFNELGNFKPVHVTPTGIEKDKISSFNFNGYPSLFQLGALDWIPNQEGLIWFIKNCWPLIYKKHPQLKFYIAGRNAPKKFVSQIQGNNIVYCGEVENANEFMNDKSIMIVPLLSGSGMRIKIIEGMAMGKAIVTTSIGTEGINSVHNENILIADYPSDFEHSVSRLVEDKSLFEKIGRNAIHFVSQNFDNLAITNSLLDFYKKHLNMNLF